MPNFITYLLLLMIYSFLGWLCESLLVSIMQRKAVNSGFLNGPICPIYGFGALFVLFFLQHLTNYPWLVFILGILITSSLEYFTSWMMEILFHTRWWDYSQFFLNIKGRICFLFSMIFGFMTLFVIYILNPQINALLHLIPYQAQFIIALLLLLAFLIDLLSSLEELIAYDQGTQAFEHAIKELRTRLNELASDKTINDFMVSNERRAELKQHLNAKYDKLMNQQELHSRLSNAFPQMKRTISELHTLGQQIKEKSKNA